MTQGMDQDETIDELARRIRGLGLSAPGIALLEANKPLAFLGSQFLLFVQPLLDPLIGTCTTDRYIGFLQDRDNIERLIQRLEADGG